MSTNQTTVAPSSDVVTTEPFAVVMSALQSGETLTPAAIAQAYGIPQPASKDVQAFLKSVKDAGASGWKSVVANGGSAVFADPSRLARDVKRATDLAAHGRGIIDGSEAFAARLIMTVRQVNPKATASAIGRSIEGDEAVGATFRQRWSRYDRAAKIVAASTGAVKDGKREDAVTVRQALTALQNGYVDTDTLVSLASKGESMPTKSEASALKGETTDDTVKATTGAQVVNRAVSLADAVKALDHATLSDDQRAEIARLLDSVRTRLAVK